MDNMALEDRERRLAEIREEAEQHQRASGPGIRPQGSPMPVASPQTGYYQQPMLKQPQWTPLVPLYFFVGGASGSLGVIGSLADLVGKDRQLARRARRLAAGGAALSSVLLIADLGRPSRFLNMLRVFKLQSAMSIGSWVLSAFSAFSMLSVAADLLASRIGEGVITRSIRGIGRTGSVLFGLPFHNYTGVLLAASVIPVWNNRVHSLPREFGVSGLQSAIGLLELSGSSDNKALNVVGLLSAATVSREAVYLLRNPDAALRPAKRGISGILIQASGFLSGPLSIVLRLFGLKRRNRRARLMAAGCALAGSVCMRYGWVLAGKYSSQDWRLPMEIEDRTS